MPKIVDVPTATRGSKYLNDNELALTAQALKDNPDKHIQPDIEEMDTRVKARYAAAQVRKALVDKHAVKTRARIFEVTNEDGVTLHAFALKFLPDNSPEATATEVEPEEADEAEAPAESGRKRNR